MPEDNSSTPKIKKGWVVLGVFVFVFVSFFLFVYLRFKPFIDSFLNPPEGNINMVLLGKGGAGHEAPDLTDTIIFASVGDSGTTLISLPRDIWVPEIRAKLNSAYYWGKQRDEGFKLVDESVGKITGQTINYNLVLDFSIFKKIVDSLGGIEVNVENSFVDEKYPIPGKETDLCDGDVLLKCRYETLEFKDGTQIMNGETALKFVRSRNAEGDEGTDIARERRQQLVISSIQKKITSPSVYLNPVKLKALWDSLIASMETDVNMQALGSISGKMSKSKAKVKMLVLPEDYLVNPPVSPRYDNQYVFIPEEGSWNEVNKWVQELLY